MVVGLVLFGDSSARATEAPEAWSPTLEERAACFRAVEEVRWQQRIWPDSNPGVKPTLDDVLPAEVFERRAVDAVVGTLELERRWGHRITGRELELELQRMARGTRDPDGLRRLWDALDRDPLEVAECLVRPAVVERRLRERYSRDPILHAELRRRAESELAGAGTAAGRAALSARTYEIEWRVAGSASGLDDSVLLPREELERWLVRAGAAAGDLRQARAFDGHFSALVETETGFRSFALLETLAADEASGLAEGARALVAEWSKRPFEDWWQEIRSDADTLPATIAPIALQRRTLPTIERAAAGSCEEGTWRPLASDRRWQHSAVWTGSEMIVWGGRDQISGGTILGTGAAYDPSTDTWQALPTAGAPIPRQEHSAVWTGSEMIIWGGRAASTIGLRSGAAWNPGKGTWSPVPVTDAPSARYGHTATWVENEGVMVVWGGIGSCVAGFCSYPSTGGVWDPGSGTWEALPTADSPSPRHGHTAVTDGGNVLVWGGRDDADYLGTGALLSKGGGAWSWVSFPTLDAPAPRAFHSAVWTGVQMVVWGGRDADGVRSDGGRWILFGWDDVSTSGGPPGTAHHTASWTGDAMIIVGGETASGEASSEVWSWDLDTDSWDRPASAAPAVSHQTAVFAGDRILTWGGRNDFEILASGIDWPADGTSSSDLGPLAGIAAPSPRRNHAAAWTGAEMIVWGGRGYGLLDTGGRYDPATDTWMPTSRVQAPSPREGATATWTGTELVVLGGSLGGDLGGSYTPMTDSWSGLPSLDAPVLRESHAAVWSGSEVIVWGGYDGMFDLSSGARYRPLSHVWIPISSTDEPGARSGHSAVWTGSEMVVYGGDVGAVSIPYDDGARYDPVDDTWMPIVSGIRRAHPTAVWTGDEMVVWDGPIAGGVHASIWNPALDEWRDLPATDFDPALSPARSVWTGREMLAWTPTTGATPSELYRIDPSSDSVDGGPVSSAGPSAASGASMVWTGTEAIVWGGWFSLEYVGSGAGFCSLEPPLFADGFESGDTGAWGG